MMLALLVFLLRPAQDSCLSVWLLAGLLPVLVAVTAALQGQAAAARDLAGFSEAVQQREVVWPLPDGQLSRTRLPLSGLDAACVVHGSQHGGKYQLSSGTLDIPRGLQFVGDWPTAQQVNALMVAGRLHCRRLAGKGHG